MTTTTSKTLSASLMAALCCACALPQAEAAPDNAGRSSVQAQRTAETPAQAPRSRPESALASTENPAAMPELDPSSISELQGLVDHVERAGPYTYVQFDEPSGGQWVVVMGAIDPSVGRSATFAVYGTRSNFYSKRLDRELDELHFGRLLSPT